MGGSKLRRSFWISLLAGIAILVLLTFFMDAGRTLGALSQLQLAWLPLILALSLANYLTRFVRWEYFLRVLGIRLSRRDSVGVFIGGFLFSVTPGKIGELVKAVMVKEINGTPLSRTAPVVLSERFTDLGGLLLLAAIGVVGSGLGIYWLAAFAIMALLFFMVMSPRVRIWLPGLLARLGPLGRRAEGATRALDSTRELLRPRLLAPLLLISAAGWFWECLSLAVVARALGADLTLSAAVMIYSLGTLAGIFTPGGLVATEGILVTMMLGGGMAQGPAAAVTIVVRLATLWFAVGLGGLAVIYLDRRWKLAARIWSPNSVSSEPVRSS